MSIIERSGIVVLLAMFDTVFTLYHVSMGAVELNPILAYALEVGAVFFIACKMLFTITLCGFLMRVCTTDFRFWLVGLGLNAIILTYTILCLYHLYLFLEPGLSQHSYF